MSSTPTDITVKVDDIETPPAKKSVIDDKAQKSSTDLTPKKTIDQIVKDAEKETVKVNSSGANNAQAVGANAEIKNPDDTFDDDLEFESADGAVVRKNQDPFTMYLGYFLTFLRKFFLLAVSTILAAIAGYFEYEFRSSEFNGVPVWRLLYYFATFYPAYVLSDLLFEISVFLLRVMSFLYRKIFTSSPRNLGFDIIKSLNNRRAQSALHDLFLFLRRYKPSVVQTIWAIFLTLSWAFALSPYIYSNTISGASGSINPPGLKQQSVLTNLENVYDVVLRLHIVLLCYFIGVVFVNFVVFKYLYQFSFKHYIAKVFDSIFRQTILLALAGIKSSASSSCTYLLPNQLFKTNGIFDATSQHRLEHAAARYVLQNKLEKIFSYNLDLPADGDTEYIQKQLSREVRNNLRKYSQLALTTGSHNSNTKAFNQETIKKVLQNHYGTAINIEEALKVVDEANTNFITSKVISTIIEKSFKDRAALMSTLTDSEAITLQVKNVLHKFINVILLFIALIVFRINILEAFLSFSTIFLGFSFVFGSTMATYFENIIFLYTAHPYDVGDTIQLDTGIWIVKRVLLETTELVSLSGEVRKIQNKRISQIEPLLNLTQSKGYWTQTFFVIDAQIVNQHFIDLLSADVKAFIDQHPDEYQGYFRIDYYDFIAPLKVKLMLGVTLSISWAFPGRCRMAQNRVALVFVESLVKYGGDKYTAVVEFNDKNNATVV